MELLFWLLSACAALWFLDVFGNGFLLNSVNGSHQLFSTDNLFRLLAFKQLSTGDQPNISSFASLNIDIVISDIAGSATAARLDPILSSEINPSYSSVTPTTIPSTPAVGIGFPDPRDRIHPSTNPAQHNNVVLDDPPTHTLQTGRQHQSQPDVLPVWATAKHVPPIICVTASLLRQMQNQNQFIPVSP